MNDGIYKMWCGQFIDLSKIITISDAYWIDRMGSGGWFVGFHIQAQLRENVLAYEFDHEPFRKTLDDDLPYEQRWSSNYERRQYWEAIWSVECVRGLQVEVDKLVSAWRDYRKWVTVNSILRPE